MFDNLTETEEKIIHTSLESFFRYGLRSVSMDDLSRKLGISKKTLYQSVANKKDLINKVIGYQLHMERQVLEALPRISNDAMHEMVQLSEHIIEHFSDIAPSLIHDLQKYYPELWEQVIDFQTIDLKNRIETNIRRGQKESFYRKNLDPDVIAKLYVGMCFVVDEESVFPTKEYDRTHVIGEVIMYHMQGILSKEGREHTKDFKFFQIAS